MRAANAQTFDGATTEVGVKSPGNAKTLRIKLYIQNWGRFPKVGLGLTPGLLTPKVPPYRVRTSEAENR